MRRPIDLGGLRRPGALIGGVQGGVSSANLQQVLETKGLSSSNLATALSGGVATGGTPSAAPVAAPVPITPASTSTPSKS
jgi:hypothetical protein